MSRRRYTSLQDRDLLNLVARVSVQMEANEARSYKSRLFKIVQRTDTEDFVAIIEEVRK